MELFMKEINTLHGDSTSMSSVNWIQAGKKQHKNSKKNKVNKGGKRNTHGFKNNGQGPLKYFCYGGTHIASKCRNKENLYCEFCKSYGHLTKVCFKKQTENKSQQKSIEIKAIQEREDVTDSDESEIL